MRRSAARSSPARLAGLSLALVAGGWLALGGAAPQPAKPAKSAKPEAPKAKPAAPANAKPPAQPIPELAQAAKQAENQPALRKLFEELAVPFDVLEPAEGQRMPVEPIAERVGPDFKGAVNFRRYLKDWKPDTMHQLPASDVRGVMPYEEIVLRRVREFRNNRSRDAQALAPIEALGAAEKVLAAVLRWHDGAREGRRREVAGWDDVRASLSKALFDVRYYLVQVLAAADDWKGALAVAQRGKERLSADDRLKMAQLLAGRLIAMVKDRDAEVPQRLRELEEAFPRASALEPLQKSLRDRGEQLLREAQADKDEARAAALLERAEALAPGLPELRSYIQDRRKGSPGVLGVGVQELPEFMTPALAVRDSERQAVELVFESLVRPVYDPVLGQLYEPQLAAGEPRLAPLGRDFVTDRQALWSNGMRVTGYDVQLTVNRLRDPDNGAGNAAWAALMESPTVDPENAARVRLTLYQGVLEPAALMTFKVLPLASHPVPPHEEEAFARDPIGSGPYKLKDPPAARKDIVRFVANPYYKRAGAAGQPFIREIHFFHSDNPAADFPAHRLHLLWEPTNKDLQRLAVAPDLPAAVHWLPNQRVYFLAVNHRKRELQDAKLRRALAQAIDRAKILDAVFRAPIAFEAKPDGGEAAKPRAQLAVVGGKQPHRLLGSLYPPDAWACLEKFKPKDKDLLSAPDRAKGLMQQVTDRPRKLTLKFPAEERVQKACELIRDQVKALGIELELLPVSVKAFHEQVEQQDDFELAYCHYDYPDATYWLWPLFNARRPVGGRGHNFFGYENADLEQLFRQAVDHREFAEVKRATHAINLLLDQEMPLIPLWQIDTRVVLHRDLEDVRLHPLLLFTDVATWKLPAPAR